MLASMLASETHGLHRAVVGGARAHASPTHDAEMHSITQYDQNPRSHIHNHMCPCPDGARRPAPTHVPRPARRRDARRRKLAPPCQGPSLRRAGRRRRHRVLRAARCRVTLLVTLTGRRRGRVVPV